MNELKGWSVYSSKIERKCGHIQEGHKSTSFSSSFDWKVVRVRVSTGVLPTAPLGPQRIGLLYLTLCRVQMFVNFPSGEKGPINNFEAFFLCSLTLLLYWAHSLSSTRSRMNVKELGSSRRIPCIASKQWTQHGTEAEIKSTSIDPASTYKVIHFYGLLARLFVRLWRTAHSSIDCPKKNRH